MAGTLWVDPLNIIQYLPHTGMYVVLRNIGESLLDLGYAQENPTHVPQLLELCGKKLCDSSPELG